MIDVRKPSHIVLEAVSYPQRDPPSTGGGSADKEWELIPYVSIVNKLAVLVSSCNKMEMNSKQNRNRPCSCNLLQAVHLDAFYSMVPVSGTWHQQLCSGP